MVILACSSRMHCENMRQGKAIAGDVEPEYFSVRSVAFQYVWPHLFNSMYKASEDIVG